MAPIQRYRPGDVAPATMKYRLVDHFGEDLNVSVWCEQGARLPFVAVAGFNPVWYIQAVEVVEVARAA